MDRLPARFFLSLFLGCVAFSAPTSLANATEYVVVTREALASEFQRLADFKTANGVPAAVRTIESIDAQYPGGIDAAERVRLYLIDAHHNEGVRWVLLGGDAELVPVRYAHVEFYGGQSILTDYYFMCLEGTWNADGDALFGEVEDEVDLVPEVYAGRAPVSTAEEARLFVDKTIAYQQGAGSGQGYPASAVFLAELPKVAEEAIATLRPSFDVLRLYTDPENWPGSLPLSRQAALVAANRGFGIVAHIGHSTETTWSVGEEDLTTGDIDALTNGARTSLVVTMNGKTAAFDAQDAIGEHWLTAPNGGGMGYIGYTNYTFVTPAAGLQREWFTLVFEDGVRAVGEAAARARLPFVTYAQSEGPYRHDIFALVLLGDPELRIRVEPATTGIEGTASPTLSALLHEPAPNPFVQSTRIAFEIPAGTEDARLAVYDAGGRLIQRLHDGAVTAGRHTLEWDGRTARGTVPPGVYFLELDGGGATVTRKLVVAR